uniref:Uncharacterized protein n=1 Tax=Monopterus albus TaxID=43700 RepID=A0A3Q3IH46_MONAL
MCDHMFQHHSRECVDTGAHTLDAAQPVDPPLQTMDRPLQTVDPPLQTADPPLQTVDPPLQTANPPLQTVDPPLQTVDPPLQTANPPLQTTKSFQPLPPIDSEMRRLPANAPDHHSRHSNKLNQR